MQLAHGRAEDKGVHSSFQDAARFLATTSTEEFLERALGDRSHARASLRLVSGIDHVGFMVPVEAAPELGAAARAAGFDLAQSRFESTILARWLGELAGRDAVPTTIFKAHGESWTGAPRAVEALMPRDVDREVVREWIRRGIGAHVALRMSSPSGFPELVRIMSGAGFRPPAFMNGRPLGNPAPGATALFFDRRPAERLALEFCHYER